MNSCYWNTRTLVFTITHTTTWNLYSCQYECSLSPPKVKFWKLLKKDILQTICPSCRPANSVKALKAYLLMYSCLVVPLKQSLFVTSICCLHLSHWTPTRHHSGELSLVHVFLNLVVSPDSTLTKYSPFFHWIYKHMLPNVHCSSNTRNRNLSTLYCLTCKCNGIGCSQITAFNSWISWHESIAHSARPAQTPSICDGLIHDTHTCCSVFHMHQSI